MSRADSAFCLSEGRRIDSVRNLNYGTGNQGKHLNHESWEKTLQRKENHAQKTLLNKEKVNNQIGGRRKGRRHRILIRSVTKGLR